MKTLSEIIMLIAFIWSAQAIVAGIIHMFNKTENPKNGKEFMLLTFAPYVIYCLILKKYSLNNKLALNKKIESIPQVKIINKTTSNNNKKNKVVIKKKDYVVVSKTINIVKSAPIKNKKVKKSVSPIVKKTKKVVRKPIAIKETVKKTKIKK